MRPLSTNLASIDYGSNNFTPDQFQVQLVLLFMFIINVDYIMNVDSNKEHDASLKLNRMVICTPFCIIHNC